AAAAGGAGGARLVRAPALAGAGAVGGGGAGRVRARPRGAPPERLPGGVQAAGGRDLRWVGAACGAGVLRALRVVPGGAVGAPARVPSLPGGGAAALRAGVLPGILRCVPQGRSRPVRGRGVPARGRGGGVRAYARA